MSKNANSAGNIIKEARESYNYTTEECAEKLGISTRYLLKIENVGNLICPVVFDLGSHMRIVVVSVTEGDDTVEKHPLIFQTSDLVGINKVDLADAVGADADKMVNDAKRLNPDVQVIKASLKQGEGLSEIISAINKKDS